MPTRASMSEMAGGAAPVKSCNCRPMVSTGLKAVIGSWNTMATARPRKARIRSGGKVRRSVPSSRTTPDVTRAAGGSRFIMAAARVDLPQPDSPMIPSTSPFATASDTSRNA